MITLPISYLQSMISLQKNLSHKQEFSPLWHGFVASAVSTLSLRDRLTDRTDSQTDNARTTARLTGTVRDIHSEKHCDIRWTMIWQQPLQKRAPVTMESKWSSGDILFILNTVLHPHVLSDWGFMYPRPVTDPWLDMLCFRQFNSNNTKKRLCGRWKFTEWMWHRARGRRPERRGWPKCICWQMKGGSYAQFNPLHPHRLVNISERENTTKPFTWNT